MTRLREMVATSKTRRASLEGRVKSLSANKATQEARLTRRKRQVRAGKARIAERMRRLYRMEKQSQIATLFHTARFRTFARDAHRLAPDNWTYKRQAWSIEGDLDNPLARFWQGPAEGRDWPYESDWLTDIRAKGAEQYYRNVEL